MKRLDLVNKVREIGLKSEQLNSDLSEFVLSYLDSGREDVDLESLKIDMKLFISKVKQKYIKSSRHFDRLLKNESKWLSEEFVLKLKDRTKHGGTGRPKKSWDESGERTKRQRVAELSCIEPEPLVLAAVRSAKKDPSKSDLSCVLKKSLKNVSETKKALETPEPTPMTPKEALSLQVQCGFSDNQYQIIKNY